jgi:hypothetical protein
MYAGCTPSSFVPRRLLTPVADDHRLVVPEPQRPVSPTTQRRPRWVRRVVERRLAPRRLAFSLPSPSRAPCQVPVPRSRPRSRRAAGAAASARAGESRGASRAGAARRARGVRARRSRPSASATSCTAVFASGAADRGSRAPAARARPLRGSPPRENTSSAPRFPIRDGHLVADRETADTTAGPRARGATATARSPGVERDGDEAFLAAPRTQRSSWRELRSARERRREPRAAVRPATLPHGSRVPLSRFARVRPRAPRVDVNASSCAPHRRSSAPRPRSCPRPPGRAGSRRLAFMNPDRHHVLDSACSQLLVRVGPCPGQGPTATTLSRAHSGAPRRPRSSVEEAPLRPAGGGNAKLRSRARPSCARHDLPRAASSCALRGARGCSNDSESRVERHDTDVVLAARAVGTALPRRTPRPRRRRSTSSRGCPGAPTPGAPSASFELGHGMVRNAGTRTGSPFLWSVESPVITTRPRLGSRASRLLASTSLQVRQSRCRGGRRACRESLERTWKPCSARRPPGARARSASRGIRSECHGGVRAREVARDH